MTGLVPVLHRDALGYPEHEESRGVYDSAVYTPLSYALTERFTWDAHFCAYSLPLVPRRLATDAALALAPTMVAFVVDVDAPSTSPEWRAGEAAKVEKLLSTHKGGYVYQTRHGYRIIYALSPITLCHVADKRRWSETYLDALRYLAETFGIIADKACADWTRLYRLPFALREGVATEPAGPAIGDPAEIGVWAWDWESDGPPSEPSTRAPTSGMAPRQEKRAEAVHALGAAWPSQGRHQAQLALSGALARAGWDVDAIAEFCADVAEAQEPGNRSIEKRLSAARSSVSKLETGEAVVGWPTVEQFVGPEPVRQAMRALGLGVAPDPDFVATVLGGSKPTRLEVRLAVERARDQWRRAKKLETRLDGNLLAKILKGELLWEHASDDCETILVQASLAVARAAPPGATRDHLSELLVGPAGRLAGDVPKVITLALSQVQAVAAPGVDLPEPADDNELKDQLELDKEGRPRASGHNIERVLRFAQEMRGKVRFNLLTKQIEVTSGRFQDETPSGLPVGIKNWLGSHWQLATYTSEVADQLLRVAQTWCAYDPVAEYLEGLQWDGQPRLGDANTVSWLTTYCLVKDAPYVRKVGTRFLISACARALAPGCQVDTVLVLEGDQGVRKSTTFAILGGEWFTDTPMVLGDKDSRLLAASKWLVELGELKSLLRDDEASKGFLSQRHDDFRPPYGRAPEQFKRRCVFAGTTNEYEYLQDATGNRRYWAVRVGRCDTEALRRDRDQLWAEAVYRYSHADLNPDQANVDCKGERWWFLESEQLEADEVIAERRAEDPWVQMIIAWTNAQMKHIGAHPPKTSFTLAEIAENAIKIDSVDMQRHNKALSRALREAGFEPKMKIVDGQRRRLWARAGTVVMAAPNLVPKSPEPKHKLLTN